MDYQKARSIRKRSLLSLINEQKFGEGKSLSASIKGAASQKFQAKAKGIKESLDPLNWVRKATGKGALGDFAVTGLGRLFGRSEKDIKAFGGIGRKKMRGRKDPQFTTIAAGPIKPLKRGDGVADVLAKMYNFMMQNEELHKLNHEIEKAFKQEELDEDDRRHNELVKTIKKYMKVPKTAAEEKKTGGGFFDSLLSILDKVKEMISEAIGGLKTLIAPLLEFMALLGTNAVSILGKLGSFLLSGTGLSLLAMLAVPYFGNKFLNWLNDRTPNMKALSPNEAEAVLKNGSERDIEALGGREKLEDIIKYGKQKAKEILERGDPQEILAAGGKDKLEEIVKDDKTYQVPEKVDTGPEKIPPRPDTTGGKNSARAKSWDNKFGEKYNPDGTKKQIVTPTTTPVSETPKEATPPKIPTPEIPAAQPVQKSANSPVPQAMPSQASTGGDSKPIISVNSSTNTIADKSPPKLIQTNTARARNADLDRYLMSIAVIV